MFKDFSINDIDNNIEIMVICEFNYETKQYEVIFTQAIDYETGYPITISNCMDYTEQINDKLLELNYDTIK